MSSPPPNVSGSPEQPAETTNDAMNPVSPDRNFSAYDVFFGPDGLRAVWGILIFVALREAFVAYVYPLVQTVFASPFGRGGLLPPREMLVYEGAGLFCVGLATWLMAKIERRPTSVYGFGRQRGIGNFCAGLGWGVVLLSLLIVLLRVGGLLVFDARMLVGSSAFHYGLIWLGGFLLVGLMEETLSRGYLQFTLTRLLSAIYRRLFGASRANMLGFWTAALILSFAFGFGHRSNPGESPLGLLSAGVAGLLFCLSLWRTGSLWWAIGFHASWDWAQSFLYGVADSGLMAQGHLYATHPVGRPILSGGLTGPEGSVLMLPVMAVGAVVILFTLPRTHLGYMPANAPEASLN